MYTHRIVRLFSIPSLNVQQEEKWHFKRQRGLQACALINNPQAATFFLLSFYVTNIKLQIIYCSVSNLLISFICCYLRLKQRIKWSSVAMPIYLWLQNKVPVSVGQYVETLDSMRTFYFFFCHFARLHLCFDSSVLFPPLTNPIFPISPFNIHISPRLWLDFAPHCRHVM